MMGPPATTSIATPSSTAHGGLPKGAHDTELPNEAGPPISLSSTTTPKVQHSPPKIQRQNSNNIADQAQSTPSKPKARNVRNLTLAPSSPPSITPAPSSSSVATFSSLGETATAIAAQRGLLSPTPPPIRQRTTPRFGPIPLQTIPSSRPGTPSIHPDAGFAGPAAPIPGAPRTPGFGFVPLTPTPPTAALFSPNSPFFSPNASQGGITSPTPPTSKTSKLKSQLTSLLPVLPARHTYFHAKIEIQQLSSVPFVGGQFGVRWKFRNVQRHAGGQEAHHHQEDGGVAGNGNEEGQGLLGRVTGRAKNTASSNSRDKGKAREHDPVEAGEFGNVDGSIGRHRPQHQESVSSARTSSSRETTSTSESTSSYGTSTSATSAHTNWSSSTKVGNGTTTPNTNLSRNFYSPYSSNNGAGVSPSSKEAARYGASHYLFATPSLDGSSAPSSATADPGSSLLFSPNSQSFSSNAASTPMSPNMNVNVLSPTGTVTQANYGSGTPHMGNTSPLPGQTHVGQLSAARGLTPYLPLKDHKITFNFPLEAIVKMDVTRGSGNAAESTHHHEPHEGVGGLNPNDPHSHSNASVSSMAAAGSLLQHQQQQQLNAPKPNIQPSPLKLVVMQRVIPDDPSNSPQNPRLGEVVLNLAEYVGKGKVERRFLLKESRVNAMLKLSIEVTYASGYTGYVAPPMPKAEILGDIQGLLTMNETLLSKKKARVMLARTTSARSDANGKDSGTAATPGDEMLEGADVEEAEVDLKSPGLLEREKDRLAQVLAGETGGSDTFGELQAQAARVWEQQVQPILHVGNNFADPYALPSESESESEFASQVHGDPRRPQRRMTAEELGRRKWKMEIRTQRKEERSKKLMLDLSESEDESAFESADDGLEDDEHGLWHLAHQQSRAANATLPGQVRVSAFDIQRLPLAAGPKTTEALIDALFNPAATTKKENQGPFTMYVSPTELHAQHTLEEALKREMDVRSRQRYTEHAPTDHHHWQQPKKRSMSMDTGESSSRSSPGGGLKMRLGRTGKQRAGTMDSTSTSTTSGGSGSGGSPNVPIPGMKSPGEDTIMGVRMGYGQHDEDDHDVTSPATITAVSPNRGQHWKGLGMVIENSNIPGPSDQEATIGKTGGGGSMGTILHNYYRAKKDKKKGVKREEQKGEEVTNILGGVVHHEEPGEMSYGQLGHHQGPTNTHQRTATGGTVSSESSSSLSSLSLSSKSGHGHGAGAPGPHSPSSDTRRSSDGHGPGAVLPSARPRQPDLSVPDGRMDKMGVVKGVTPGSVAEGTEAGRFGSIKGWWKGLQK